MEITKRYKMWLNYKIMRIFLILIFKTWNLEIQ